VDLLDIITWEQMKKIIMTRGGMRIKFPTASQLAKLHDDYIMHCEVEKSDLHPDAIAAIARKHSRSVRSAQDVYEEMTEILNPARTGEHTLDETHPLYIAE
jgi:hypothetical protein